MKHLQEVLEKQRGAADRVFALTEQDSNSQETSRTQKLKHFLFIYSVHD